MMETTAKTGVATANNEWAVILAGGNGTRLKSLTRHIAGDERPKQFCSVMGGATLLEEFAETPFPRPRPSSSAPL